MSTTTPYLDLFKIIPEEDAKKTFNFYEVLNDNWDKLDNAYSTQNIQIQTLLGLIYNTVYRIGQPIIRLDNYLAENEVRLEGEEKLISEFPLLYQVYGDTYGEARTGYFKLPDSRNRVFWGANDFGYIEAGLPDISVRMSNEAGSVNNSIGSGSNNWENVYWNASAWNSIYGKSNTVQPPAIKVRIVTRFK